MRVLLDTHAFIWWDAAPQNLSVRAKAACFSPDTELMLSAASVWEMQIKAMLGKLTLRNSLQEILSAQIRQNGLVVLPIKLEHVFGLDSLPPHHKDPFDRMIVAQAISEGCAVISHDSAITQYSVEVIW